MGVRIRCKYCHIHLVVSESAMGGKAKCTDCYGENEVGLCVKELPPHPSPHVAGVLSAISPGLGYIYCGKVYLGFFWSFIHSIVVAATVIFPEAFMASFVALLMQFIFAIFARDEAYKFYRSEALPVLTKEEMNDTNPGVAMKMIGQAVGRIIRKLFGGDNESKT